MNADALRKKVLLARCELDRQELHLVCSDIQNEAQHRWSQVRRATPWVLVAAPLAGGLVARLFRRSPSRPDPTVAPTPGASYGPAPAHGSFRPPRLSALGLLSEAVAWLPLLRQMLRPRSPR
jgi:hypothetical protein